MRKVIMKSAVVSAAIAISATLGITANAAGTTGIGTERETSSATSLDTIPVTSAISSTSTTEESSNTDTTLPPSEGETTLETDITAADGEIPAETTATTTVVTTTTTEWYDSPYADGMLSDEDLYNYVLNFINDDATLDTQGSGVLIGENIINPEAENETDEMLSEDEKFTSGEKVMYSVATRDGSIFYIIIDKGANGENVYFLNSVDIVDLASLINTEDENLSAQEKEILNEANAVTGSYDIGEETPEEDDGNNGNSNNNSSNINSSDNTSSASSGNNTLYIVLGVGAVLAIAVGWYFKIGPGKKNNVGFEDDDEDEEAEEEYYEEDTDEYEEGPVEESYEEE